MNSILIGFVAGVLGTAYFVYGKRRSQLSAMLAGAALCIYPYFVDGALWLCVIGVLLLAVPFVIR